MALSDLQAVAAAVVQLAKRRGYATSDDVCEELRIAGLPEEGWKAVIALAKPSLVQRGGRYYLKDALSPRVQKVHAQQQAIQKVIRRLIKRHRSRDKENERRGQARVDFIQPVKIRTADGKEFTLLSRDLSATGCACSEPSGFWDKR